jgi:carbamoyl-phosphate synthase large subunit
MYRTMLITGCGGDIGFALGGIAREAGLADRIIGCDLHADHPGTLIFDACETLPPADAPDYFDRLRAVVDKHNVDVVVPMSEAEIERFAAAGFLQNIFSCDVIAANALAIRTGLDKLNTYQMLRQSGLPAPWTEIVGEGQPKSFPCIVKPRRGQGGKGIIRVQADMAQTIAQTRKGDLWQELILPDDAEFTCGLYRAAAGSPVRTIIFSRQLQGGITRTAQVVEDERIDALLRRIADAVELVGAINVQLRVNTEGPKVFEINPRFSSTVGFRDLLGYRDFIWSVMARKGLEIADYQPPAVGTKIYRGASLFVLPPA